MLERGKSDEVTRVVSMICCRVTGVGFAGAWEKLGVVFFFPMHAPVLCAGVYSSSEKWSKEPTAVLCSSTCRLAIFSWVSLAVVPAERCTIK